MSRPPSTRRRQDARRPPRGVAPPRSARGRAAALPARPGAAGRQAARASRASSCCPSTTSTATSRPPTGPLHARSTGARPRPGGAEYLPRPHAAAREVGDANSLTVAAGDLIGGSTLPVRRCSTTSPPSSPWTRWAWTSARSATTSSTRAPTSCCGCSTAAATRSTAATGRAGDPYDGADFDWLAANVVQQGHRRDAAARHHDRARQRHQGRLHRHDPRGHPDTGQPGRRRDGRASSTRSRPPTRRPRQLRRRASRPSSCCCTRAAPQTGTLPRAAPASPGPIVDIAHDLTREIDAVVTGHTHQPYMCTIPDPPASRAWSPAPPRYGRWSPRPTWSINRRTKDVVRSSVAATNHLVTRPSPPTPRRPDHRQVAGARRPVADRVVGTITADITGDAAGDRGSETPMGNLIADAILFGTGEPAAGPQFALMNLGGIRADLLYPASGRTASGRRDHLRRGVRGPAVRQPAGDRDLTGAQIDTVLEQQYQPVTARGRRPMLALGASEGFTYTWDAHRGRRVAGQRPDAGRRRDRPGARPTGWHANFLADGGDLFTEFTRGHRPARRRRGPAEPASTTSARTTRSPPARPGAARGTRTEHGAGRPWSPGPPQRAPVRAAFDGVVADDMPAGRGWRRRWTLGESVCGGRSSRWSTSAPASSSGAPAAPAPAPCTARPGPGGTRSTRG